MNRSPGSSFIATHVALAALVIALFATACATVAPGGRGLEKIEHIVVIYAENRSFDHLYGLFPGARARCGPRS